MSAATLNKEQGSARLMDLYLLHPLLPQRSDRTLAGECISRIFIYFIYPRVTGSYPIVQTPKTTFHKQVVPLMNVGNLYMNET